MKLKAISPKEIPPIKRSRKPKPFYHKFHKKVEKLLKNAGFEIVGSDFYKKGADIVANANGNRIIVQCRATQKGRTPSIDHWVDEYSTKVKKEKARAAILALEGFRVPKEYLTPEKRLELLREDKVVIWNDELIEYYKSTANSLKEYAKYSILGDLGFKKEFDKPVKVPALLVRQGGYNFFVFTLPADTLLKIAYVFRREYPHPKSYQRMLKSARLTKIGAFLDKPEGFFPNAIICVLEDKEVRFRKKKLNLPMKYSSVWIIDGQHRLYGFCKTKDVEKRKNFGLVCVGLKGISEEGQGKIFVDVNKEAKSINTELLYDLYDILGIQDRRVEIVKELAKTKIFKNKIKTPRTRKAPIGFTTFVNSVGELVKDHGILSVYYRKKKERKKVSRGFCLNLLKQFFNVVSEVFQDEWKNSEISILADDIGIRTFTKILPQILEYKNKEFKRGFDEQKIKKCLEALKGFNFKKEACPYYGDKGARVLVGKLTEKIRETLKDFPLPAWVEKLTVIDQKEIKVGEKTEAHDFIDKWLYKFEEEVVGELMFIDPSTFKYLKTIPSKCKIKLVVGQIKDPKKCKELAETEKERLGIFQVLLVGEKESPFFHGRWLADKNYEINLETDLKDDAIANKEHLIRVYERAYLSEHYKGFYEKWDPFFAGKTSREIRLRKFI